MFEGPIALAVDGSSDSDAATGAAVELSSRLGAPLHVLHVAAVSLSPFSLNPGEASAVAEDFRRTLDETVAHIQQLGGSVADAQLREGDPVTEIVSLCREVQAGIAVLGTRGRSRVRQAILGSVSSGVVRESPCPVLLVGAGATG